jgi:hypothetical protein
MKYATKGLLAICLSFCMIMGGCVVPAWVSEVGTIINALAPAVIDIINIIAIAEGKPVNTALEAKVTQDAADIKSLATDFATASAASAPAVCAQLQTALATFNADQQQVLQLIQISNPATQQKANLLFNLVSGTFQTVAALIPNCQSPVALRAALATSNPQISGNQFVNAYNSVLTIPTGLSAVDSYTKAHKIHSHSKFVRIVSFGLEK